MTQRWTCVRCLHRYKSSGGIPSRIQRTLDGGTQRVFLWYTGKQSVSGEHSCSLAANLGCSKYLFLTFWRTVVWMIFCVVKVRGVQRLVSTIVLCLQQIAAIWILLTRSWSWNLFPHLVKHPNESERFALLGYLPLRTKERLMRRTFRVLALPHNLDVLIKML